MLANFQSIWSIDRSKFPLFCKEAGVQFAEPSHWALAAAAAAGVTAARQALIATWPAYRDASDRSNRQVIIFPTP